MTLGPSGGRRGGGWVSLSFPSKTRGGFQPPLCCHSLGLAPKRVMDLQLCRLSLQIRDFFFLTLIFGLIDRDVGTLQIFLDHPVGKWLKFSHFPTDILFVILAFLWHPARVLILGFHQGGELATERQES